MLKYALVAAALVACISATAIPVELCPGLPGPVSFDIPECTGLPCDVSVGQRITLLIGIDVPGAVTALPVTAQIIVGSNVIDYELPTGDACSAIATGCPQAAGKYMVTFPVTLDGVPSGTDATVRVQINDQDGNGIACGNVSTTFN